MSDEVEVDPGVLERAARRLEPAGPHRRGDTADAPDAGSPAVRSAVEDVRRLLDAGGHVLASEAVDAAERVRSAAAQWRARDTGLGAR